MCATKEIKITTKTLRHLYLNEKNIFRYSDDSRRNAKTRSASTFCCFSNGLWSQHLPPGITLWVCQDCTYRLYKLPKLKIKQLTLLIYARTHVLLLITLDEIIKTAWCTKYILHNYCLNSITLKTLTLLTSLKQNCCNWNLLTETLLC